MYIKILLVIMNAKWLLSAAAFAVSFPAAALALPFSPTPQGFTTYLNNTGWNDGKSRQFSGLRDCYQSPGYDRYSCKYGYVKITDPVRGSVLCELQQTEWKYAVRYLNGQVNSGPAYPCRSL